MSLPEVFMPREAGYFAFARERYQIFLRRQAGAPGPWTDDPVLQQYRFCNVRREDDRTTAWFRENIRDPHRDSAYQSLLNTIVFRWFNRIETAEVLLDEGLFEEWSPFLAKRVLEGVRPVVTGAYVIKTPTGLNKLDGVLWCIERLQPHLYDKAVYWSANRDKSLQQACDELMEFPYLGGFMAHQLVADLKYTCLLDTAPDRLTWAFPGPGTTRGIGRTFYGDPDWFSRGKAADRARMLEDLRHTQRCSERPEYWPAEWPRLEMSDISNVFCEYDKYLRVKVDGQRMKQRFTPHGSK